MGNSQEVYNAVIQSFRGFNAQQLISEISSRMDISFAVDHIRRSIEEAVTAPSTLFRPKIYMDGNQWCALYGENLQDGVAGFGKSPADAMANFDANWDKKITPTPKPEDE